MNHIEIIILLLFLATIFAIITRNFLIPFPVVFTTGGVLLSFIPGLPILALDPNTIFILLVPPILFFAAYLTSWRDFWQNIRPISLLALVLVTLSTLSIAYTFTWLFPKLPWILGCILGAIISPPDAIAATAITGQLSIPRRIITILEGESLVNDASALVIYKFAVAAIVTNTFSISYGFSLFVLASCGSILLGLIIGWLLLKLAKILHNEPIHFITIILLTPFITYTLAEKINCSGVLSVVTAGLFIGRHAPKILTPAMRLKGAAVWETIIFITHNIVFLLMGLQLPVITKNLIVPSYPKLAFDITIIVTVTIFVRFFWVFFATYGLRAIIPSLKRRASYTPWRHVVLISWAGMRGIVSLGAALALPLLLANGQPFPARHLIIFLTFASVVAMILLQGITLPLLIKLLNIEDDGKDHREERIARKVIGKAMLQEINLLKSQHHLSERALEIGHRECSLYANRKILKTPKENKACLSEIHYIRQKMITSGRQKLLELRQKGIINDDVMHLIQSEFDLDESRLQIQTLRTVQ